MYIRYYEINMWEKHQHKIYLNIKAALYNNFISVIYNHCSQTECNKNIHNSSLIIFNYPNSTDNSLNIIQELYNSNKNILNNFYFNFEGKINIENNLFNYVYKGTKILNIPTGLYLRNTKNGNNLKNESILLKDENVSLHFDSNEKYKKNEYVIEYAYVLTEPNYEYIKNYSNTTKTYGDNINEKIYYKYNEYTGKSSNFTLIISEDLITNCNDEKCALCFNNFTCITCKYNYTFNSNTNEKTYLPEYSTLTIIPKTTIHTTSLNINPKQDCTVEDIVNGKCKGKITSVQIRELYRQLKLMVTKNTNKIIETENVIFQISSLEEQKNSNNPNISSIDLGVCEQLLKTQEGLSDEDNLIVFKIDIKNEDLSSTYVQYELYNPKTLKRISIGVCTDISISVKVPVNLDESSKSLYDSLSQLGYNLFDLNDSFYNDICSTYTTENGTDLTLADRKNLIYDSNGNVSMCQDGCSYQYYNLTTKKAKCNCQVQVEETIIDLEQLKFDKNQLVDSFYTTLKNSNFLVLKCYKLIFSVQGQKNNIGSYIMSGITFIFIILLIIYIINGNAKLNSYIQSILKLKLNSTTMENKNSAKPFTIIKNDNNIFINKNYNEKIKKHENENQLIKENKGITIFKKNNKSHKKSMKNKGFTPQREKNKSIIIYNKQYNNLICSSNEIQQKEKYKTQISKKKKKKEKKLKKKMINKKSIQKVKINQILVDKSSNDTKIQNIEMYLEKYKIKELNDEEMNSLEYELAIILDKRTYLQYYYSLLKKKHIILFTFLLSNDYNLIAVKVSLLLLSFSLYFTINGFFFSDETMKKINKDNGSYDFIYHIPKILYSTVISAIINMILKTLSLSEKQILSIKLETDFLIAQKKSKTMKMYLKIKLALFFILSFILMLFFWYFISCFCAVYKNTQIVLIKDTLVSFALSMVYPFGLNLLPGMFRLPALRSKKKNKKCLYKISGLIALI